MTTCDRLSHPTHCGWCSCLSDYCFSAPQASDARAETRLQCFLDQNINPSTFVVVFPLLSLLSTTRAPGHAIPLLARNLSRYMLEDTCPLLTTPIFPPPDSRRHGSNSAIPRLSNAGIAPSICQCQPDYACGLLWHCPSNGRVEQRWVHHTGGFDLLPGRQLT
jgi:hypothetical protein